ncbi:acetylxylan esterase [bacterium]|nr:MAG: acetylxylan esterase [bacterium]
MLTLSVTALSASAQNAPEPVAAPIPLSERYLPEVLQLASGKKVTMPAQWPARRAEILELFRRYVYGRNPVERPADLRFVVKSTDPNAMGGTATLKQVAIEFAGGKGTINLILFTPNNRTAASPVFLLACNRGARNIDPTRENKSEFWPAEELIKRGYVAAAFLVSDLDPDKDDDFKNGVHGLFDPPRLGDEKRSPDAWATIAAWAWGASRVLDYLESDKDVDAKRVAIVGHSRGGKTALWAGATDPRFALVVSNDSGSTGAALARGKRGETIALINKTFPYWFNTTYKTFDGNENELPVDQHQLIALMAPRPVYIASAIDDEWADPQSEFLSGVAASPVYELLGKKGMTVTSFPELEKPLHAGFIGYHVRRGGHDLSAYDWTQFMDFADLRMPNTK